MSVITDEGSLISWLLQSIGDRIVKFAYHESDLFFGYLFE